MIQGSMSASARIVVVGTSGSGKTTFCRALAAGLGLPHIELDAPYWGPEWTPVDPDVFRSAVQHATAADAWICDGNYSVVRDLVWGRADTLVWLNYSFPVVFFRAVRRTVARLATGERLFAGNRESWRLALDPDWIPWWVIRTFHRRRREYPALFRQPGFLHLRVLELRKPAAGDRLLNDPGRIRRVGDSTIP